MSTNVNLSLNSVFTHTDIYVYFFSSRRSLFNLKQLQVKQHYAIGHAKRRRISLRLVVFKVILPALSPPFHPCLFPLY